MGGYIVGMDFNRQVAFFVLGVGCSLVVMCLRLRLSVGDLVAVACFFFILAHLVVHPRQQVSYDL